MPILTGESVTHRRLMKEVVSVVPPLGGLTAVQPPEGGTTKASSHCRFWSSKFISSVGNAHYRIAAALFGFCGQALTIKLRAALSQADGRGKRAQ